jgi:hypothetical protein
MDTLVGLSIRQPWIDMILRAEKTIEVRRRPITRRGPIALHAAWAIDWIAAALFGYSQPAELPRGMIVGRAELLGAAAFDRESWYTSVPQPMVVFPLEAGFHGALLGKVERLPRPIRVRGKRGFFPLSLSIAEEIDRQLATSGPEFTWPPATPTPRD